MPSPKVDWSQFDVVAPAPKAAQPAAPEVDWSQFDVAQPEPAAPAVPPSADEFTAINDALSATPEPAKPRPLKGSVMEGVVPPEPTTTKIERTGAPITEETRAQLEAALSKMTPEQRDKVELRTDWIGSSVRAIRRQQRIADKQMNRNPVRTTGLPELGENRIAAEEQAARDRGPSLTKSDYDFESMKGAAGPRTGTGVLGDLTADVLSIGPTFAKSVAQITSMATGGTIGADSSAGFERGMKSFDALRSPQAIAQKRQNDLLMADPEADWLDVAKHLVKSPELLADMSISTVGSMGVPLGAAAVFAKGAAAATRASVISNAVMNAADTFESVKSGDLTDKYAGAAVSGLVSLLGGWLTEGGAEGEIARRMFQKSGAKTPEEFTSKLLQRAKVAGKEGVQEIIEEVGNVGGEVTGGNGFDVNTLMKRAAVSGIIGFAVGAAAGGGGHPTTTDTRPGSEIAQEMVDRTFGKTPAPTIPPAATTSVQPSAVPTARS
ncbi:MAG TPA: hypothetical protein PKV98_04690, partial [Burkholderiaceae bacterium]|nr:hypothetical protein [Burkholderiaceae bacterium]